MTASRNGIGKGGFQLNRLCHTWCKQLYRSSMAKETPTSLHWTLRIGESNCEWISWYSRGDVCGAGLGAVYFLIKWITTWEKMLKWPEMHVAVWACAKRWISLSSSSLMFQPLKAGKCQNTYWSRGDYYYCLLNLQSALYAGSPTLFVFIMLKYELCLDIFLTVMLAQMVSLLSLELPDFYFGLNWMLSFARLRELSVLLGESSPYLEDLDRRQQLNWGLLSILLEDDKEFCCATQYY